MEPVAFRCNHALCVNCLQRMCDILGKGVQRCGECRKDLEDYTSEDSRRRFFNFHLVDLNKIMQTNDPKDIKEAKFVSECFKETPKQRKAIPYLHLYRKPTGTEQHNKPLGPPPPKTTTMYHMHTFVASICMDLVHSGGFRFGDGFGYSYLNAELRSWDEAEMLSPAMAQR